MSTQDFATRLLDWAADEGRKDLPWQPAPGEAADPYRVWISEIMLQQTQVATVIPYFRRFMEAFPDVTSLADADPDRVLAHWSGLGYYSRARNLHRAAQIVRDRHRGHLPDDGHALETLPGIGPSTASAIVSLGFDRPAPILDGNVRRVLARHAGVEGWPGRSPVLRALKAEAEARLPKRSAAAYGQAIMDLGATVCTPSTPACGGCPVSEDCVAYREGRTEELPAAKPRRRLPVRATCMLLVEAADGSLLLQRRPPSGIWGGLWSLPEADDEAGARAWIEGRLGRRAVADRSRMGSFRHTFSHYHLDIHPLRVRLAVAPESATGMVAEDAMGWFAPADLDEVGIAAPVRRLIEGAGGSGKDGRGTA